jgi:hypothetical protein
VYVLRSFGQDVSISVTDRVISGSSPIGEYLVNDLGHLSRLSILRYLVHAKPLPPTGQLVNPGALPGGEIYVRGTHILPLASIARAFSHDTGRFLSIGGRLGGHPFSQGDVSLQLLPLPRIPVVLFLWKGDEEFPPDCLLLFDSTCTLHLPLDIIWSTAMMTAQMVLCHTI